MVESTHPRAKELKALRYIRDRLVHGGPAPSVREVMRHLGYRSPRSAALVIDTLIDRGFLRRREGGELQLLSDPDENRHERTVPVPLVGSAPCGSPLLAQENLEALVPVTQRLATPGHKYFLLRAIGDSMDLKGIGDGDLVLVRQQPVADEGQTVVALVDDEATIKEFRRAQSAILLMPRSNNPKHQPIVLSEDFRIQGVVLASLPGIGT